MKQSKATNRELLAFTIGILGILWVFSISQSSTQIWEVFFPDVVAPGPDMDPTEGLR